MSDDGFVDPRTHLPVELDAQLALLPRRATCKGMFFTDPLARAGRVAPTVDVFARAGVAPRRYLPFVDYPHAEWMRIANAAAAVIAPGGRVGDGLRELGHHAYDAIFENPIGKVLFGPLGFDLERVFEHAGTGYRLGLGFGAVRAERVAAQHWRVRFTDFPSFIETYNVGVIEGAVRRYGYTPRVRARLDDPSRGVLDVRW
ncbi:MAG: DUF2378 family protein [Polyangiales bacterium]